VRQPTGPDFVIRFPFQPHAGGDLKGAEAVGNELVFRRELQAGHDSAAGDIVGYGRDAKDNDMTELLLSIVTNVLKE
jgi:hypothetical protein